MDFWKIKSFGDSIFSGKITISEADKKQSNLLNVNALKFSNTFRPRSRIKMKKVMIMKTEMLFMKTKNEILMLLNAEFFHLNQHGERT